ncbi:recombinase family protein [Nonomuraea sp. CA-143628]|uniref:recombinase family protein n=1 Tax=Nonomuraea sp. CA-143628 TaxID=3239997 RepID=UPI003D939532
MSATLIGYAHCSTDEQDLTAQHQSLLGLGVRGVKLSLGGTLYDPTDPTGKMFFNILATFAEFEVDLLRMRTREGMAVAWAKGELKGKNPN